MATQGSRQLTARVPTVEVWWSATYGVVAREGGSAARCRPSWSRWGAAFAPCAAGECFATGCNGGGQWLLRLSAHAESLSLAVLKVGDVFFAPVVTAMGA